MSWIWGKRKRLEDGPTEAASDDDDDDVDNSDRYESDDHKVDGDTAAAERETEKLAIQGKGHKDEDIVEGDDADVSEESESEDEPDKHDDHANDDDDDDDSFHSLTTEDDLSIIASDDYESTEDEESSFAEEAEEVEVLGPSSTTKDDDDDNHPDAPIPSEPPSSDSRHGNSQNLDSDEDDDDLMPSSFWEKQGLLVLAAEHDRVDILKGVLNDDELDKDLLMNSGVPPLHLAITFSSVNTAVALLRMGADPSVRPNVVEVVEQQKEQPEDSKVEIPNIKRFDGASAWDLAFGNAAYERFKSKNSKSWSLFSSSSSAFLSTDETESSEDKTPIIKPSDMAPSKREGIRHAFTAEALRCVGADEVNRLKQLVDSGMPPMIDIGGKDLYGWAVEMGALKCEELLRPMEAAKYDEEKIAIAEGTMVGDEEPPIEMSKGRNEENARGPNGSSSRPSFVVYRPTEETVPQLKNRLDELESLAAALSTCLDNLAEEVSVCHGLLLMGGGAAALASHVKSLKSLKGQKLEQLEQAQHECLNYERELADLAHSAGDLGMEIWNMSTSNLDFSDGRKQGAETAAGEVGESEDADADQNEKKNILAQIAASEHKIRKLRASIADLSEENARDMNEVKRRGLDGGINLVRGLREELRDVEFQLSETRNLSTTYKAKIGMIHARVPNLALDLPEDPNTGNTTTSSDVPPTKDLSQPRPSSTTEAAALIGNRAPTSRHHQQVSTVHEPLGSLGDDRPDPVTSLDSNQKAPSEKIETGESRAVTVIQSGHRGLFPVDLWQVLLRIMGFERASYRRGMQQAVNGQSSGQPNTFIV